MEFSYRVKIEIEILANREQEYAIRKGNNYKSEFEEDVDFPDSLRWIDRSSISFYAETLEKAIERIRFEFHNCRIDVEPLENEGYLYWFDENALTGYERLLHRAHIHIDYAKDVILSVEDVQKIIRKDISNNEIPQQESDN